MLSVHALSFKYAAASDAALDNVSFEAKHGEVLGLLGPNGAGKTTLIGHLSGMLAIQRGDIRLGEKSLAAARAERPTRIAVAPQEYAFYPSLTVAENLACFAGVSELTGKERKSRIAESVFFSQLERYVDVRSDRLSGGLKRRLNLAIALLHQPELLLFDEPTVGVDPQSRAFLLQAIKKLAQAGCAVIYTSHYMEEVEAIADRVVILDRGRVLKQGRLGDLLGAGSTQLQVAVEGAENERLLAVLAAFGDVVSHADGVRLTLADKRNFPSVIAAIQEAGLVVSHASFGEANLEQLFMSLTHHSLRD